jgi:sugar phosphate isomerase/epimerase
MVKIGSSSLTTRLYCQLIDSYSRERPGRQNTDAGVQTILRTIRKVSEIGLELVDLSLNSENHLQMIVDDDGAKQIRASCVERGIAIERIACPFISEWGFGQTSQGLLEKQWARIGGVADVLGASVIELTSPSVLLPSFGESRDVPGSDHTGPIDPLYLKEPWNRIWMRYVAAIRKHSELAGQYGLKLALEPRPKELLNGTDSLLRLFDAVPSENLGGLVDVSHLQMGREVPELGIRKLADKVFGVHLSDNDGVTDWHWAPRSGKMNWPPIFEALQDIGYTGELSLDVSGIDIERELVEGRAYVEGTLRSLRAR